MAGVIYDSTEIGRIQDLLNKEEAQMSEIDKEKKISNATILRYSILLAGAVVLMVLLKIGVSRKKK
jgi:hypothetical protein